MFLCEFTKFFKGVCLQNIYLIHDRGPYHKETSPLICRANQWTGFYMIGTSVMKVLITHTKLLYS